MKYARMPIEVESPEEFGYGRIRYNLSESSVADRRLSDLDLSIPDLTLLYGEHRGSETLRTLIAAESTALTAADVLITSGAAGALFIIATALLKSGGGQPWQICMYILFAGLVSAASAAAIGMAAPRSEPVPA